MSPSFSAGCSRSQCRADALEAIDRANTIDNAQEVSGVLDITAHARPTAVLTFSGDDGTARNLKSGDEEGAVCQRVSQKRRRYPPKENAPEPSRKRGRREALSLMPDLLVIEETGGKQTYDVLSARWCGAGWMNVSDRTTLKLPFDIRSLVEIGVQPASGYPVRLALRPDSRRFVLKCKS